MSPLVDDGDLRWSSTRRRSTNTKRKRMSKKKMIPLVFNLRRRIASLERSSSGVKWLQPRLTIHVVHSGGKCEDWSYDCAHAALSYFNQKKKKGPKFEFVEALGCMVLQYRRIFHSNFIARPISGIEADNKLFFAELVLGYGKTPEQEEEERAKGVSTSVLTCPRLPCIIGPSGSKSGLYGCTSCGRIPGYVQHPKRGRFTKRY